MMNYSEALDFLYEQLPMFQRTGATAYKDSLDNTICMDRMFDHPHLSFKTVHVAGTNGKGSVSHMLASVFQEAGFKTGLYTSPHLKDFRERIKINGQMITKEAVVKFMEQFLEKNKTERIEPSFFELSVLMAFDYFRKEKIDVAIVEVGLGGRLDSTNIITPRLSVITNISFDHMALLGDTLPKIAAEKAGIIKHGVPVVVGETSPETSPVFGQVAKKVQTGLYFADQDYQADNSMQTADGKQSMNILKGGKLLYPDMQVDLLGIYQRHNVPTVLKAVELLNENGWSLTEQIVRKGLANTVANTGLMGRWQMIGHHPLVICDTGHNPAGISFVVKQIKQTPWEHLHIVIGMVSDKDQNAVLSLLPAEATYYFTRASIPRAATPEALAQKASCYGLKGTCFPSVKEAFSAAKSNAGENDLIFIGGSTFVVAEIL